MQIGKFKVDVVDTGLFALDGGAMFGVVPKPLWSKLYNSGDERNRIPLASRGLLIQFDDKKILVDAGSGTKLNEKSMDIYGIDKNLCDIQVGLSKFGLKASDITDFVYTHLHFDHAGGSTYFEDNKPKLTFENAQYYVQKAQWQWALNPTLKDRASYMSENYTIAHDNGNLKLIDGEDELFSGITVHPIDGHTKAMQMIKISDAGTTLLFVADLSPTTAHIKVPFVMGYDNFPLTSMEEKEHYFNEAVENDWIICFEHDAFTQAAKLSKSDKGFEIRETLLVTQ